MARQAAAVEVNAFIKGIITEASPLTFPDNASLAEENLVLRKDGSRQRRLGMDYEDNHLVLTTNTPPNADMAISSFMWKAPGGYPEKEFIVVQTGNRVMVLDSDTTPISRNTLGTYDIGTDATQFMSMASVDGLLIIVTGNGEIYNLDWNGSALKLTSGRLKIRDTFGVADVIGGEDLLAGSGIATRPASLTDAHTYNLRNQTFTYPHKNKSGWSNSTDDPINQFRRSHVEEQGSTRFPANSDNLVSYLYADAGNNDDRNTKRYFSDDNVNNPLGTNRAPVGHFVIDAMNRGSSRLSEYQKLMAAYPKLTYNITSLPTDRTPGGATVVAGYAGRVWYAGFSSQIIGGDSQSPRMTSYVLFSRLVKSPQDIYECYQDGDPTSPETPELVDTDGGFVRLDGAYNIQYMVNVGPALMVIAENGVWKITGGSGYGFQATNYLTDKITEHGCESPGSVVIVDNTFMYWSDDGIYHVAPNQYGDWVANNLTSNTIQSLYDEIPSLAKRRCQGMYDSYQRQVRWLYFNYYNAPQNARELILDVNLSAFYPSSIQMTSTEYPRPMAMVRVPPFQTVTSNYNILSNASNNVVDNATNNVVAALESVESSTSEIFYVVADSLSGGNLAWTFAYYRDAGFVDFRSKNGKGKDAAAYLLTGWSGMGDFQRQKQIPYLTVYSIKTETGFTSDYVPVGESSILVQSQWNWTNSEASNKWGKAFQAYRHKRVWLPGGGFEDGNHVVVTRNKLRGRGRVLSLLFKTEPGKDFHLLGWSFIVAVNGNV